MSFPDSARVLYDKNPLTEVICQLRFPTILRIGTEQPAGFQEKIRNDYPIYKLQEPNFEMLQPIKEISSILEQVNFPFPPGSAIHRFGTVDNNKFIALAQDFIAITEATYEKWGLFRAAIEKAEKALKETYNPAFYTRIGLRYKDIISRQQLGITELPWNRLLQPYILGELGNTDIADNVIRQQTTTLIKITDIQGGFVKLNHGLITQGTTKEQCYIIDADFHAERKEGTNEPFELLDKFNKLAGRLFRWAITDDLHGAMHPKSI